MNYTDSKAEQRKFGAQVGNKGDWETAWSNSDKERLVMVAEFHAWLIKTRVKTETRLYEQTNHLKGIAPFAQAGIDLAATPADVPLVVIEFATAALDVMETERQLNLLNVYYGQAASEQSQSKLRVEPGNEAEVNALWDWFIKERGETAE